ncbi:hypothetical protein N7G274_004131 [Stereocaulon virgatum]|uniref:DUF3074 domain-containing protein n=1 Tax=Stereocaulon virgatum TaxID=373712 RepID=A0ABR4AE16_9LECA
MAALHTALQSLSPTPFSSVPTSQEERAIYLRKAFASAQKIVESVPLPPPETFTLTSRPRSSTTASTSSAISSISCSSARSEPLDSAHLILQKEWGKPIKLNAKDNPLGMSVYKLAGKDGRGAWFARRSVHEGMGFMKWKLGLQREFPETLEVQGGPGEGNIRGIGGERRVERGVVEGVGCVEVYHLSAQFPGPTTPRDFVTLLLTSSTALSEPEPEASDNDRLLRGKPVEKPRHFMVISRPCEHPDCPPRDGFVRGQYESVEFIREIPLKPKKAASTTDLLKGYKGSPSPDKEAILRSAEKVVQGSNESLPNGDHLSLTAAEEIVKERRQRGKTISFAESRGSSAKGEALDTTHDDADGEDMNPVEWIMITRSDPGGSVPRFMVERGTPGSIVADASKFLDWACKKEHAEDEIKALEKGDTSLIKQKTREELEAYNTNGHLAGLEGMNSSAEGEPPAVAVPRKATLDIAPEFPPSQESSQRGLLSTISGAAYASLETYAPQAVIDRLPGHQQSPSMSTSIVSVKDSTNLPLSSISTNPTPSISSSSSIASFASAEDHFDDASSLKSTISATANESSSNSKLSPHEKELAKLNDRKRALSEKLAKVREKETKDKELLNSKEGERIKKAEEKHAKEVAKQEEKFKKEVARLEAKRVKEAAKMEERRKRAEDKDEKARLVREKEEMRQELEVVSKERDILREQVGALQRENTALVVKLGKIDDGKDLLLQIKAEVEGGGRSRSASLRNGRGGTPEKGREATVLAGSGEKKEVVETLR